MNIEVAHGIVRVAADHTFSTPDVERLRDVVTGLGGRCGVFVDFSRVRSCDEVTLAVLAIALVSFRGANVIMSGVNARHCEALVRFERDLFRSARLPA